MILLPLLIMVLQFGVPSAMAQEPLRIYVGIDPQAYLAGQIGGERVEVETLVPAQASPEAYQITPRQLAALSTATLYLQSGMLFEDNWLSRLSASQATLQVLDCRSDGATPIGEHPPAAPVAHATHATHAAPAAPATHTTHAAPAAPAAPATHAAHAEWDPHFWIDPLLARDTAECILNALRVMDPEGAAYYQSNYQVLAAQMEELDRDIARRLHGLPEGRHFFSSHPAWGYFARRYGLVQVSLEYHGHELSARRLTTVIELARKLGARAVFTQPQFSNKSAKLLGETLAIPLVSLDPLAAGYPQNLLHAADLFNEYLR